ncbi:Cleavage polyadenylation factor subunit clp1 [Coemansia interrupta]|uniref:Polynucleotide 5'-hydroxyl-kinase GRC3 n=1 Tax=Coemansia interrupta TaxID=1126814 RepID=A0A9W8LK52_9FUNG|nr:Cleavage polyadenylation factor subunit clp1 [Coemansia interrupta]
MPSYSQASSAYFLIRLAALLSGHAELFGAELGSEAAYTFSGFNGAIFSWQGCTLSVSGDNHTAYVAGETPMDSYINVHMALQQLRVQAHNGDMGAAPRVMIVGPEDSGKTSLARLLLNYAVRMDQKPLFVDLDTAGSSMTVPGTVSVTPVTKTIDIEDGFMGYATSAAVSRPVDLPLVWQYGHELPSDNPVLFNILVDKMAAAIDKRVAADKTAAASGLIVDTHGSTDISKLETIEHAIRTLKINTLLVVGNERMYSLLSNRLETMSQGLPQLETTAIKLAKSGGTVDRDAAYRQQQTSRTIKQYFYGTTREPLTSFPTVVNFKEISVLRVGEDVRAPSSTLPLGETRKLTDTSVFEVDLDESLFHSVLAVTDIVRPADFVSDSGAADAEGEDATKPSASYDWNEAVGVQAIGFVNVSKIDMEKKRFTMTSPVAGRLPKQVLLDGYVKWMEVV